MTLTVARTKLSEWDGDNDDMDDKVTLEWKRTKTSHYAEECGAELQKNVVQQVKQRKLLNSKWITSEGKAKFNLAFYTLDEKRRLTFR